jgi:hypothetical protein
MFSIGYKTNIILTLLFINTAALRDSMEMAAKDDQMFEYQVIQNICIEILFCFYVSQSDDPQSSPETGSYRIPFPDSIKQVVSYQTRPAVEYKATDTLTNQEHRLKNNQLE